MKFFLTVVVGIILLSIFFIPNGYFTQLFTDKENTTSAIGNLLTIITFLAGFILVILPMKIDASRQKKTVQTRLHTYLIKRNRFLTVLFFLFLIEMVLLAMLLQEQGIEAKDKDILLGIPLPTIYLAEEANGKEVVIDGQQRLTAVKLFMENEFKLIGIQSFPELNKKLFKELPDDKMKTIENGSIRTITFRKDSDEDLKFAIFERLNTGSVPLNDMELRNCIYRGNYIELLKKMAENTTFRKLIGIKTADKRMKDVELVLRFSALYHATYLNYEAPIKTFLNKDAKKYQKISKDDAEKLLNAFHNSLKIIDSLFADKAFKRYYAGTDVNNSGYWENKKFNVSLYDALMFAFRDKDINMVMNTKDLIREAIIGLMTSDEKFIESISRSTSSKDMLQYRCEVVERLIKDVLNTTSKQPRCFTLEFKQYLFDNARF